VLPVLLVAAGSALGAPSRYLLDRAIQSRRERVFPFGALVVNVTGSFLLGLIVGISDAKGWSSDVLLLGATGFIGGYTTFSTYAWESLLLLEDRAYAEGVANLLGTVAAGLSAAALGLALGALG
jgi:fluoride exporter